MLKLERAEKWGIHFPYGYLLLNFFVGSAVNGLRFYQSN